MSVEPAGNRARDEAWSTSTHPPAVPLLAVERLRKYFPLKADKPFGPRPLVQAVDDVSFTVEKGETLGIVGESGCGKSTTARLLMHLIVADAGSVALDGVTVSARDPQSLRDLRRQMQMVFQDSYASLNPRMTLEDTIAFGPYNHGMTRGAARTRARELLATVGLEPAQFARRYPHQISGGQRQRVNCARALAMQPRLLILDEAVSALDKSVEAQMLNLLIDLKRDFQLTYLFISHDLNVVHYLSERVLVMYLGKVVELGPAQAIYRTPRHPYTQALLASRLSMDPDVKIARAPLTGDPPNPINPPSGCRFRTRCAFAEPVCAAREPPLLASETEGTHGVACHMCVPQSGHSKAGTGRN